MFLLPKEECSCAQVLIADDEIFNNIVLEGQLNQFGIDRVDQAKDGKEALSLILDSHNALSREGCSSS